jgi:hypothetical protein
MYKRTNKRAIGYRLKVDPILTDNLSKACNRDFFREVLEPLLGISASEWYEEDESVV